MKALVVDDDGLMAQTIAALLQRRGVEVQVVADGAAALVRMAEGAFDAVLLDMRLRGESGLDVLRAARGRGLATPVIILSGDMEIDTKVAALRSGADDYVTKPFRIDELLARITAVVRRPRQAAAAPLRIGGLELDLAARLARAEGRALALTVKEYDLLEALAQARGRTLTKEDLVDRLYPTPGGPGARIIDVFLCKLRRKLSAAGAHQARIETVWGAGYRLVEVHEGEELPLSA